MATVGWVIATILAIDLLIVVSFVTMEMIDRRRIQREVSELDALWRSPSRSPLRRARGGGVLQAERERTVASGARSVGHPRLIGNVALSTAVVAMLALVVVATLGGQPTNRARGTASTPGLLGGVPDFDRPVRHPGSGGLPRTSEEQLGGEGAVLPSEDPGVAAPSGQAPVPATFAAHAASWRSIVLVWAPVAEATGYEIERRSAWDAPDAWTLIGGTQGGETTFRDDGLESATTYFYRITAVTPVGIPAPSDVVSATTPVEPPPATWLTAIATSSTTISLSWVDVQGETGYRIERAIPGDSKWTEIGTTGADVTEYADGGLTADTKYRYRVFSVNESGAAPSSNPAQATTHEESGATIDPPPGDDDPPGSGKGKDGAKGGPPDDSAADDDPVTDGTGVARTGENAGTEDAGTDVGSGAHANTPSNGTV